MRRTPTPLPRPVLVLDGWHSPGLPALSLTARLAAATSGRRSDYMVVSYPLAFSVEAAAGWARDRLRRRGWLGRELDVVGVSMGGIVARTLAGGVLGPGVPGPLRIARLFTLVSPHRGAKLADVGRLDRASAQLRAGSELLERLDAALPSAGFQLTCYAMLRDWLVGATRTAPAGWSPIWIDPVAAPARALSHFASVHDARILADLAARLRGEPPPARGPSDAPID
jgi:hypothetical protein